jgi:hypothetical protein
MYECVSFGMWFCVAGEVVKSTEQGKFFLECLTLKMKALQPFKTPGTTQNTTHHHMPEDLTLKYWNTYLFLNKQTTLLCICGLTQENKKHNTHISLKHNSCYMYNDLAFKTVHFSHWVYSHVSTIFRINNDYFPKTVLIDLALSWRCTVFSDRETEFLKSA